MKLEMYVTDGLLMRTGVPKLSVYITCIEWECALCNTAKLERLCTNNKLYYEHE